VKTSAIIFNGLVLLGILIGLKGFASPFEAFAFLLGFVLMVANVVALVLLYQKKFKIILSGDSAGQAASTMGIFILKMALLAGSLFVAVVVLKVSGLYLFLGSLVGMGLSLLNFNTMMQKFSPSRS